MKITVEALVRADVQSVWTAWNSPDDIKRWNAASDDWHTTRSEVDLRVDGRQVSRMEAKDGSMGFDFGGTYTRVEPHRLVELRMDDDRMVTVEFVSSDAGTTVRESFDAESENDAEMQRQGWQAILDNFASYVESGSGRNVPS